MKCPSFSPVLPFQMRIDRSNDALAMSWPFGENRTWFIALRCPVSYLIQGLTSLRGSQRIRVPSSEAETRTSPDFASVFR